MYSSRPDDARSLYLIPELEDSQVDRSFVKHHRLLARNLRRLIRSQDSTLIPTGLSPMLLARPSLYTSREFQSSFCEEYYSYFINKPKKTRQNELSYLAYYTRQSSSILALDIGTQGEAFLLDCLWRKK